MSVCNPALNEDRQTKSGIRIGKGTLAGRGVYANRDFKNGEVAICYFLSKSEIASSLRSSQ